MTKITGSRTTASVSDSSARVARFAHSLGGVGLVSFVLLAVLVLWLASPARAAKDAGRHNARMISASADPAPGGINLVYRAPDRGVFTLTQACSDHIAVYVEAGTTGQRLTYGTSGCTYFDPGITLTRGERLQCVNKAGVSHSCTIMGLYEPTAPTAPQPKVIEGES